MLSWQRGHSISCSRNWTCSSLAVMLSAIEFSASSVDSITKENTWIVIFKPWNTLEGGGISSWDFHLESRLAQFQRPSPFTQMKMILMKYQEFGMGEHSNVAMDEFHDGLCIKWMIAIYSIYSYIWDLLSAMSRVSSLSNYWLRLAPLVIAENDDLRHSKIMQNSWRNLQNWIVNIQSNSLGEPLKTKARIPPSSW